MKILVDIQYIENARDAISKIRHHLEYSQYIEKTLIKNLAVEADDSLLSIIKYNFEVE